MTIISYRHKLKFYLSITLGFIFFLAMGSAVLFGFIKALNNGLLKPKDYILPVISMGVYFLAFYTVYKYNKNSPKIQMDNEGVSFNGELFFWKDLENVELTGKRPFKYFINFPMEAATLNFKNGQIKYIFDDMYANSWQIKSFLKTVVIDKKEYAEKVNYDIKHSDLSDDFFEIYKGNQFTSLRGILLWALVGFLCYVFLNSKKIPTFGATIFLLLFCSFWFFLNSWLMNYFKVSQNFFIVKNHNFFWKEKGYKLSDIKEIVFETQGKMPNCLRIITKDFRNKLYPAGTLRDKTWLELKDKLESYNIRVRNECI